ncbi:MAG: SDR family oxidoreductase [Nitriliruptorales bacterium]|nr:SDR family oxidoreductase [Nitriliruptorales bacterium]
MRRSVFITGASTGIGLVTARRMADKGWRVFAGVRKEEDADAAAEAGFDPVICDVTSDEQVAAAAEQVTADKPLDGLVNNAGVAVGLPLEAVDPKDFEWQLAVNVLGPHRVTRALLPSLIDASGRVVNVGSISGRIGSPFLGPYVASKHALEGWSDVLRREVAQFGVKVSVIQPGAVKTPIWDKARDVESDLAALPDRYREQAPGVLDAIVRSGAENGIEPEEVADAIEHALTAERPRARYAMPFKHRVAARVLPALPAVLSDRIVAAEIARRYSEDWP